MRRVASAILLIPTIVLAAAFVAEWGIRILSPQPLPPAYLQPDPHLGQRLPASSRFRVTGPDDQSYEIRSNGLGMRMDEAVDRSSGRRRILVYGSTSAFGLGMPLQDSYVHILAAAARSADPRAQVVNAAVPGYGTGHVHLQASRHLDLLKPRLAVYFVDRRTLATNAAPAPVNAVTALHVTADGQARLVPAAPFVWWERLLLTHTPYATLVRHAHLRTLAWRLGTGRVNWRNVLHTRHSASLPLPAPPQRAEDLAEFAYVNELHLQRLAALCRRAGVPLLVVWVPDVHDLGAYAREPEDDTASVGRAMLSRLADDTAGLGFLNPLPRSAADAPPSEPSLYGANGHFNANGAAWFAARIQAPFLDIAERAGAIRK